MLNKLGCMTVIVDDGLQAINYYQKHVEAVDVILMDYEMPVMNGLDSTQSIRHWEQKNELSSVAIIALTAHALGEYKEKIVTAGMDDMLMKPVLLKQLSDCLGKIENRAL